MDRSPASRAPSTGAPAAAAPATRAAVGRRPSPRANREKKDTLAGYLFLAPALAVFTVFLVLPILFTFFVSLTSWNGITPVSQPGALEVVGAENYRALTVEDGIIRTNFALSLKNTLYYVIGVVPLQTALALSLASIVNQRWITGRGFFRTAFYLPSVTSSVVISLIFMFMFNRSGIVNRAIAAVFPDRRPTDWLNDSSGLLHGLLGAVGVTRDSAGPLAGVRLGGLTVWDWLSGPSVTMSMIMLLNVWTTTGTLMVIYLAALQNIPASVYEAAAIDGATSWRSFRAITVPLLRPTTYLVITTGLISTFQVFDQIFVITQGGPANSTVTIAYIVYQNAFQNSRMGLAAATSLLLFLIIFLIAMVQRRVSRGVRA